MSYPILFSHHTFSLYLIRTGNFNLFAIVCTVAFIIVTIIVLIVVLSVKRHSAKYYTNEDKRNGKSTFSHSHSTQIKKLNYTLWFFSHADGLYEKNIDTLSITGNELSYKFPIDDIIYTIDEVSLQPSCPPLISFTTRNG